MLRGMDAREWRLTVEGELSDRAGQAFAGMQLTHKRGNTVLIGRVRDQAELQGHLQRVSDLGLTLLDATVVDDPLDHADPGPDRGGTHEHDANASSTTSWSRPGHAARDRRARSRAGPAARTTKG